MPRQPNNSSAFLRLPKSLKARASAAAKEKGISLSELIRRAVAHAIPAVEEVHSPLAPNGALGMQIAALLERAGKGDLESLRLIFDSRLVMVLEPTEEPTDDNLHAIIFASEAVMLGRLVASHGDSTDARRLAAAMVAASRIFRNVGLERYGAATLAESVSILEQLAEHGGEISALCSQHLIARESASMSDAVRTMRANAKRRIPEDV
jgi:hypothetical protein